jgi:hypothetical protein
MPWIMSFRIVEIIHLECHHYITWIKETGRDQNLDQYVSIANYAVGTLGVFIMYL